MVNLIVVVGRTKKISQAKKSAPKSSTGTPTLADQGLDFCNQLYRVEKEISSLSTEECYNIRKERSKPIVDASFARIQTNKPKVTPKSLLGKALSYALNQKSKLLTFLEDGQLEIDNNRSERSIKPFVIIEKIGYLVPLVKVLDPVH